MVCEKLKLNGFVSSRTIVEYTHPMQTQNWNNVRCGFVFFFSVFFFLSFFFRLFVLILFFLFLVVFTNKASLP